MTPKQRALIEQHVLAVRGWLQADELQEAGATDRATEQSIAATDISEPLDTDWVEAFRGAIQDREAEHLIGLHGDAMRQIADRRERPSKT